MNYKPEVALTKEEAEIARIANHLTLYRYKIMVLLYTEGVASTGYAAKIAKVTNATMTGCTQKMREQGLLTIRSGAADARKQMLSLTQKGIETMREFERVMDEVWAEKNTSGK